MHGVQQLSLWHPVLHARTRTHSLHILWESAPCQRQLLLGAHRQALALTTTRVESRHIAGLDPFCFLFFKPVFGHWLAGWRDVTHKQVRQLVIQPCNAPRCCFHRSQRKCLLTESSEGREGNRSGKEAMCSQATDEPTMTTVLADEVIISWVTKEGRVVQHGGKWNTQPIYTRK